MENHIHCPLCGQAILIPTDGTVPVHQSCVGRTVLYTPALITKLHDDEETKQK